MEGHGGEGPPASDAILFALVCFACGIFIKLCLKWTRIPYTAMLLVRGCRRVSGPPRRPAVAEALAAAGSGALQRRRWACGEGRRPGWQALNELQKRRVHPFPGSQCCSAAALACSARLHSRSALNLVRPALALPPQLWGLAIGFLQLANPMTEAFTNTLQIWLVSSAQRSCMRRRQQAVRAWATQPVAPPERAQSCVGASRHLHTRFSIDVDAPTELTPPFRALAPSDPPAQSMDPHLLLLIFLPIIGFSAAVSQEPHVLRKSWVQVCCGGGGTRAAR